MAVGSASVTCKKGIFSGSRAGQTAARREWAGGNSEAIGGHGSFYTFGRKEK